ncbi:hypothetical protein MKP08_13750 [Erythrobacter sp. LQ02-29]|uniref:hypothetical protein n=1 Tax=Erythrobacter sp. LQ02-29 TaxID=2920384 RepID=UPI001F4E3439|nr:hypothetical protein [Erythrobacter sp. LQ02-29]MCP9223807.1 hypothetical protein [Erythrobacter sp. LQ02-29]
MRVGRSRSRGKKRRFEATIFGHDGEPFERESDKAEKPGEYFHPLLGSLITGAARLMLAITERLIAEKGLEWAFCDTDSMAIAKPQGMANDDFSRWVHEITDWFAALNPYEFSGSILKIEGENFGLETGELEPLFCWAVSSKRYALFNLASDGNPVLRKVSAHGLGHLLPPYPADNYPTNIPAPHESVLRSGVERWHCDLWFEIVRAGLGAKPDMPRIDFHPAMNAPAVSRYGATAPELLRWFNGHNANRSYRDQVKPFGFLLALRAKRNWQSGEAVLFQPRQGRPPKVELPKPVALFDRDLAKVAATAFDRASGKPVSADALQSYVEVVAQYHLHPESKFLGGGFVDRGTTRRRHNRATGIHHIGKEANELDKQQMLGVDSELNPDYGLAADGIKQLKSDLAELSKILGNSGAAKALRLTPRRLRAIQSGDVILNDATVRSLFRRIHTAKPKAELVCADRQRELLCLSQMVRRLGLRGAARELGVDASNLRRKLS